MNYFSGFRISIGDHKEPFCLQSTAKSISYAITLDEKTPEVVSCLLVCLLLGYTVQYISVITRMLLQFTDIITKGWSFKQFILDEV